MNMVFIMVPFLDRQLIRLTDRNEHPAQFVGYGIVYDPAPVFDNKDQMVMHGEH